MRLGIVQTSLILRSAFAIFARLKFCKYRGMETFIIVLAILAGVIGIVGSILPALPGPPLGWVGLLLLYFWGNGTNAAGDPLSSKALIVWGVVVILVSVLDYIVPMYLTKATGGSKY